jgi:hypothetical protein
MQLEVEKSKYNAFDKNFRMTLVICLVINVVLLLCGGNMRGQGYYTVESAV